jgi:hypothetical protein
MLPARMRVGMTWGDACILNVSWRGLMIHASRPVAEGNTIELWHGGRLIVARVVWREGLRTGLSAEDRILVDEIMSLQQAAAARLSGHWPKQERRKRQRTHDESRWRSHTMEFAAVAAIAASLALGVFSMVEAALARPIAHVEMALRG